MEIVKYILMGIYAVVCLAVIVLVMDWIRRTVGW